MRKIYITLIFILLVNLVYAQIRISYLPSAEQLTKINVIDTRIKSNNLRLLPAFNIQQLLHEDSVDQVGTVDVPFRFGKGFETNITLGDGAWQNTDEGRIWTMQFKSVGAKSINFIFDDFYLPDSAELYITNADKSILYGPVTSSNNTEDGFFMTDLISGDDVTICLFEPASHMGEAQIKISKVVHAYKGISVNSDGTLRSSNALLPCHNDVVCYSDWDKPSSAVALILLANGTSMCSGALIMSADNSFKPYLLTAFHCIDVLDIPGTLTNAEINQSEYWMFKFGYKKHACTGSDYILPGVSYNGASFRAANTTTDFALMEMTSNPGATMYSSASWLGWDRSGNTPLSGTYIHHPQGAPMKISFDADNLSLNNEIISWNFGFSSSPNTHWKTILDNGTMEGGSSGSPLLNENKRIIGQLHGGSNGCAPVTKYAGAFHLSWAGGGTNATRLSNWLDPRSSQTTTTNTAYYPSIYGSDYICASSSSQDIQYYSINNLPLDASVTWQCSSRLQFSGGNSGTSCAVYGTSAGGGIITANINTNGTVLTITKNIDVSTDPADPTAHVYVSYSSAGSDQIRLEVSTSAIYGIRAFIWNAMSIGGGSSQSTQTGPNGDYWVIPKGNYEVEVRAVTQCGHIIGRNTIYAAGGYSSLTYPNPADQTLHLKIEEIDTNSLTLFAYSAPKVPKVYNIRFNVV